MTIDVIWLSLHEGTPARGVFWDMEIVESLFTNEHWTPPHPLAYTHHEVTDLDDWPDVDGCVLVLPARYHTGTDQVAVLMKLIAGFDWCVVVLCGDEESAFPHQKLRVHDRVKVWVQTPTPEKHADADGMFGDGWPPGLRECLRGCDPTPRPLEWFFAGQVTHNRRESCVGALKTLAGGHLIETASFTAGLPQEEYWRRLVEAKVAPAPSGPETVDTFRTYEALEAGCVPIVDGITPDGANHHGYWPFVLGEDPPFPIIMDWERDLSGLIRQVVRRWPQDANECLAWWIGQKRKMALRFDAQVRELSGVGVSALGGDEPRRGHRYDLAPAPDDLISVIVPTSPVPRHPATDHLEETLASIRDRLPRAEIILVADPPRPELAVRHHAYQEYLQQVCWKANLEWTNVLPILLPDWRHQALAVKVALEHVTSPLLLFVEHDTPLVGEIPWAPICEVLLSGAANSVRFYHEVEIHPDHAHLMLGGVHTDVMAGLTGGRVDHPISLLRTVQWSQRPHLARVDFYRNKIMPMFRRKSRTFIEDVVHGVQSSDFCDRGEASWHDWRTFLYAPSTPVAEGGIKRSTHLDSRADDPKFAVVP